MAVKSDFESAPFNVRQRIRQAGMRAMQPHRHFGRTELRASRGRSQKKHFLPRRKYSFSEQFRKNLRQPGAATKYECSRQNCFATTALNFAHLAAARRRDGRRWNIF